MPLIDQQFAILTPQAQAHVVRRPWVARNPRHHAGHVLGLPEHLVESDFTALTLERRDVDLAAGRAPLR